MLQQTTKINGALRTPAVKEVVDSSIKTDSKSINRHKIQEDVFDIEDSVADNAKMMSLMMSMFYRLYEAMPQEVYDNLSPEDKGVVEYAINAFKSTRTRADNLFDAEGTDFIDRIFERQGKIGTILG